jgi:hypothetical protein
MAIKTTVYTDRVGVTIEPMPQAHVGVLVDLKRNTAYAFFINAGQVREEASGSPEWVKGFADGMSRGMNLALRPQSVDMAYGVLLGDDDACSRERQYAEWFDGQLQDAHNNRRTAA